MQGFSKQSLYGSDIEYGIELSKGTLNGKSVTLKFGDAENIDTADGFVDIWDGVGDANADKTYTFSTTANIDTISSSSGSDTVDIEIQGLDTNWDYVTQTITLIGQSKVTLPTSLIRVFRMKNIGATDLVGQVYCYVDGTISSGVPTTAADIRAIITIGNNQTLMAIYTVPNSKTGFLSNFFASISRKVTTLSTIKVKVRPFGQVFQVKHVNTIATVGTSKEQHFFKIPLKILAKSDIMISADTSVNDAGVSAGFDVTLLDD